ncbi:MAG: conjugal transfer protein TraF [Woeseiaceae bacterium]
MQFRKFTVAGMAACCSITLTSPVLAGATYGIYDARTLAMGGASVASANNDNAQFYNSALLAFNEEIEERTQDGRILIPVMIPRISESAIELEDISSDDLSNSVTRSIGQFNAMPGAPEAQAVVDATANLDGSLAELENEDLFADVYIGLGLSEPGKFQGAGFFMGTRLLAGGQSTITENDRLTLAAYQEGLTFVASGGTMGTEHPELFDANGALIDPTGNLDSTATATGATITEVGVAISDQIHIFGHPFAAGISFKVLDIETFEDVERVVDDRVDVDQNTETEIDVNFDIGLVKEIGDRWRIGLAVKDIIPHNYKSSLGTTVRLRPRPRMGVSYQTGQLQIAADVDLIENEPLGDEQPTQEAAFGLEWALDSPVRLRAGYRHDMRGNRDGIVSIGVGTMWKRLVVDAAYAEGSDAQAAGFQFGMAF